MGIKLSILFFFIFQVVFQKVYTYQLWKQCDPQWGNVLQGSSSIPICFAGDLMTSITMAVTSMPTWINPLGMNQWLKDHGGYTNGFQFVWNSITPFGLQFGGLDNRTQWIVLHLMANHYVIGGINNGQHWVLITDVNKDGFISYNDPKFDYSFGKLSEVAIYGWYSRVRLPINWNSLKLTLQQLLESKKKIKLQDQAPEKQGQYQKN